MNRRKWICIFKYTTQTYGLNQVLKCCMRCNKEEENQNIEGVTQVYAYKSLDNMAFQWDKYNEHKLCPKTGQIFSF